MAGRHRAARRPDAARAGPARSRTPGVPIVGTTPGGDRPGRGARRVRPGARRGRAARAQARHRARRFERGRARSPTRSATRCWSARPTCSAGAAWRSSTTTTTLRGYIARATEISPEHPVLVDRFLDDAIEIDVDALYDGDELYLGGVMEHIEEAGIHSGDSACALPPITLGRSEIEPVRGVDRGDRPRRRRARAAQRPVRAARTTCSTSSRPTRAPRAPCRSSPRRPPSRWPRPRPAIMLGATHRPAARRGRAAAHGRRRHAAARRADRGQGGGAAVQAVPHAGRPRRRLAARPGDESTGEVMGIDRDFGTRVRQEPDRRVRRAADRRARSSSRSPTATSAR